jgi:hypothetical protein
VTTPQGQELLAANPHLSHVHDQQVEDIVHTSTQHVQTPTTMVPMEVIQDSEGGKQVGVAET